mgnify:CR=1 FL=1
MCSSGLEALTCPFSTKIFRSTDLRFTTSPAIAAKPVLQAGVLVVRVLQPLSLLSFATNCPNVFLSGCVLAFLKFLEGKGILKNNFSRVGEVEALTTALACGSALRGCVCAYTCALAYSISSLILFCHSSSNTT